MQLWDSLKEDTDLQEETNFGRKFFYRKRFTWTFLHFAGINFPDERDLYLISLKDLDTLK